MISTGKIISLTFLMVGIIALMQVLLPVASFKVLEFKLLQSSGFLTSPQDSKAVLGVSIKNDGDFPLLFSSQQRDTQAPYEQFSLSVPSIGLNGVSVYVDSNDLTKGLIHLPGASLPGEKGNVFISGHSSLLIFEKNMKAYFANLQDIKKGDTVFLSAGGSVFTYKIIELKIVDPKDINVILPPDSQGRYLSLMTCVPPGFNIKRLVVLGKLI